VLSVYLYSSSDEVYNLELLEDSTKKVKIICPHPMAADALRSKLKDPSRAEVITISKFSSELLKEVDPDISAKRKADLLGQLATIWKKKLSSFSADSFFDSFNLFTELRGYTLDFELVKEVLPFYDDAVQQSLPIYWAYLDQLGLVDEHKANEILSHHLKEGDICNEDETIVVWGFNHINSGQIDFLNSLSIRNEVIIPFSKEVFKQTRQSDWIRWFRAEELAEDIKEFNCSVRTYFYPKKRLAAKIAEISSTEKISEILLGEKKVSLDSCLEVSYLATNFRSSADLFNSFGKRVMDQIEKVVGEGCDSSVLEEFLKTSLEKELSKEFEAKNFRLIKVYSLLLDTITEYIDLSSDNEFFKFYDLQVVREILALNYPRDYFIPINEEEEKCSLFGLNELESCAGTSNPLFIISEDYQGVKKGGSKYQEEVIKFLTSLGPIQRPELEFLVVREKFREIIDQNNYTFCIQEGLLDGDRNWNDFLSGVELEEQSIETKKEIEKSDVLSAKENYFKGRLSASKLQTYIDCPRKFYYSYIERREIDSNNTKEIRPNEIGSLEHEVVENYFKERNKWDEQYLKELVEKTYKEFSIKNKKSLVKMKEKLSLYEIFNYSENGIRFILNILENLPGSRVVFEKELQSSANITGRIDCLIEFEGKIAILDFKRSSFSIANKTEIEKFIKIQLPFYLKHFGGDINNVIFWGYVNLSSPEDSLIINGANEFSKDLMSNLNFKVSSRKSVFDDMNSWFQEYEDFESEKISELQEDLRWPAHPNKDDVCTFCSVSNLCSRGGV
jgi:RecB family exonuclease